MSKRIFLLFALILTGCQTAPNSTPRSSQTTFTSTSHITTFTSEPATLTPPPSTSTLTMTKTLLPTSTMIPVTLTPTYTNETILLTAATGHYKVEIPTAQHEIDRIWSYVQRIDWYDSHGYKPVFPPEVQPIVQKSREKKLVGQDYTDLSNIVKDKIYKPEDYGSAYRQILESLSTAEQAFPVFMEYKSLWGFKIFPSYTIRLTKWGMGGSYNSGNGTIIVNANNINSSVSKTIIHETTHVGIEDVIIKRYALDQGIKERVVDKFLCSHFLDIIGCVLQKVGNPAIDEYLEEDNSWKNLPLTVQNFKNNN